jgi:hypothetical protein
MVAELVRNFPAFYGTRIFITLFTIIPDIHNSVTAPSTINK